MAAGFVCGPLWGARLVMFARAHFDIDPNAVIASVAQPIQETLQC